MNNLRSGWVLTRDQTVTDWLSSAFEELNIKFTSYQTAHELLSALSQSSPEIVVIDSETITSGFDLGSRITDHATSDQTLIYMLASLITPIDRRRSHEFHINGLFIRSPGGAAAIARHAGRNLVHHK